MQVSDLESCQQLRWEGRGMKCSIIIKCRKVVRFFFTLVVSVYVILFVISRTSPRNPIFMLFYFSLYQALIQGQAPQTPIFVVFA